MLHWWRNLSDLATDCSAWNATISEAMTNFEENRASPSWMILQMTLTSPPNLCLGSQAMEVMYACMYLQLFVRQIGYVMVDNMILMIIVFFCRMSFTQIDVRQSCWNVKWTIPFKAKINPFAKNVFRENSIGWPKGAKQWGIKAKQYLLYSINPLNLTFQFDLYENTAAFLSFSPILWYNICYSWFF